jgi:hypothetical protein
MEANMKGCFAVVGSLSIALTVAVSAPVRAAGAETTNAGTVTHLSGTLSVVRADGQARILSRKSEVTQGDTLSTQRDSYAQINFTDGSVMTLRPNTQMRIEDYRFAQNQPQNDSSLFRLLKGGLRTVTGLIGKRGNQDAYRIGTSTATIGIRGSSGDTVDCTQSCEGVIPNPEAVPPALYHSTYTGSYVVTDNITKQSIEVPENRVVSFPLGGSITFVDNPVLLEQIKSMMSAVPFAAPGAGGPTRPTPQECTVR